MMARERPDYYDDLDLTLKEVWDQLFRGANDRHSAFHEPTLVTSTTGAPAARTVILRRCDRDERTLHFHTDLRSGKVADLLENPIATIHVWDRNRSIQTRLKTSIELVESGPIFDELWESTSGRGRAMFGIEPAPGTEVAQPPEAPQGSDVRDDEAKENFVVLEARVDEIEWLFLFREGHRRARFVWEEPAGWQKSWLVP